MAYDRSAETQERLEKKDLGQNFYFALLDILFATRAAGARPPVLVMESDEDLQVVTRALCVFLGMTKVWDAVQIGKPFNCMGVLVTSQSRIDADVLCHFKRSLSLAHATLDQARRQAEVNATPKQWEAPVVTDWGPAGDPL